MPTIGHTSGVKRFGSDEKRAEQSALRRRRIRDRVRQQIGPATFRPHRHHRGDCGRSDNGHEVLSRAVVFRQRRRRKRFVLLRLSAARLIGAASRFASLTNRRTGNRTHRRRQSDRAYEKRRQHANCKRQSRHHSGNVNSTIQTPCRKGWSHAWSP